MKKIQPISIWFNGAIVQANAISMYIVNDNLSTSATFYYQICNVEETPNPPVEEGQGFSSPIQTTQVLFNGNLTMSGEDYENWGDSGDINAEAYQWAAQQLNLVLVP